jgi:hypothetical protein
LRIAFYILGAFVVALGSMLLFTLWAHVGTSDSARLFYLLIVIVGLEFLVIGHAVGRSRRRLTATSFVAISTISAIAWLGVTEKPPPCSDDVTESRALDYLRPWLRGIGYSSTDIASFRLVNLTKDELETWPTYFFYFTGTKDGRTQGVIGTGNGCGIGELEESQPFVITKVS